ncbi:MAG TPA: OmpA family protein [Chthoniobacteraceae bacterium]|nr:OmpA family protein [Chthoniobacteraceae bacterium]
MNPLETYQSDAVERPLIRRRLFWALIFSVIIHACVVYWFYQTRLPNFNAQLPRLVPRVFNVRTITLPDSVINGSQAAPTATPAPSAKPQPLDIPEDKPMAGVTEGKMTPDAPKTPDIVKPLASEKPVLDSQSVAAIQRAQDNATKAMDQNLASIKDTLLKDQPADIPAGVMKLPDNLSATQSDAQGMAAASGRLDRLLGRGIRPGDAPVTLPGGALFAFDSSNLLPAAIDQLRKLGMLIKKSPNVTFTIEGYTDSFGDMDYNIQLSQTRAEAVRTWLVQNMDVDPSHIKAVGYGATRFLITPKPVDMHSQDSIDKEKLLEQANRRVEIQFKFPQAQ